MAPTTFSLMLDMERYVGDRRTFQYIRRDAQDGCHICSLLSAGINAVFEQEADEDWDIRTTLVMGVENLDFTVVFEVNELKAWPKKTFQFCSPQGNPNFTRGSEFATIDSGFLPAPLDSLAFPIEMVAETRVEECALLANQWILTCHQSHLACRQQQLSRLPTRVIDVGSDQQQDDPKLWNSDGRVDRYIALSHCWGSGRHFITETTNLSERMKGIGWESLPKTFRDAISVTRKLGIRYLWIDSLCILQDDSADWGKELSKMSDIYKHSFLTIAAVSAENDQAGFLDSKLWHKPIALPPQSRFNSDVKIWQAMNYQERPVDSKPLETRAWAFQERLIPQRILYFSSEQMRWECNSSTWSEAEDSTGYHRVEPTVGRKLYYKTLRLEENLPLITKEVTKLGSGSKEIARDIITIYANLLITKEEDRLPALSAIANEVHLKTRDTYLAGLWKRDLLLGLLWLTTWCLDWPGEGRPLDTNYAQPGYLPEKYRAPSWSWASIESKSLLYTSDSLMKDQDEFAAQIIQAECQVSGNGVTGQVIGGLLRLSTRWFPAKLLATYVDDMRTDHSITFPPAVLPVYNIPRSEYFWPDVPVVQSSTSLPESIDILEASVQRSTSPPEIYETAVIGTVSCIMICILDSGYVAFMVLGRARSQNDAFERLGIFKIHQLSLIEGWKNYLDIGEFLIV